MARPRCRAKIHEMRFQGALLLCPQPMSHSRCRIRTRLGWKPPPLPRPPPERCSVAARPGIPRRTAHGRRGGRRRCTRDLLVRGDGGSPTRDAVAAKQHMCELGVGRALGPNRKPAPRSFTSTRCSAGASGPRGHVSAVSGLNAEPGPHRGWGSSPSPRRLGVDCSQRRSGHQPERRATANLGFLDHPAARVIVACSG